MVLRCFSRFRYHWCCFRCIWNVFDHRLILGIVGCVLSSISRKNIGPNGMATAGLVLGIIAIVFCGIMFVACAACGERQHAQAVHKLFNMLYIADLKNVRISHIKVRNTDVFYAHRQNASLCPCRVGCFFYSPSSNLS